MLEKEITFLEGFQKGLIGWKIVGSLIKNISFLGM